MNCRDLDGRHSTPLHFAAGYNRVVVVEYLLQHGADVHAKDKGWVTDRTPNWCTVYLSVDLLWVVCCFLGCLDREVILYNIILFSGLVPLHNACSYGHFEVTELLIKVFIFSIMFEEYKMYGTNAMYVVIQVWEYYHCHLMSFSAWCLCKCGRSLEVYPITWSCCQREIWNL